MVEALVALVLLSLGLLGAWALLLMSFRGHVDARRCTSATNLVRDMAERIRANPAARALYASSNPVPRGPGCDAAQPCDVAQRAAADLAHFSDAAHALFAGAESVTIEYEPAIGAAANDRYAITLRWRGSRDDSVVTLQMLAAPVAG